jgi:hypothetical protein
MHMVSQLYYRNEKADAFFFNNFSDTQQLSFTAEFDVAAGLGPADTRLIVFDDKRKGKHYTALTRP